MTKSIAGIYNGADEKLSSPWKSEYRYLKAAKGIDTDMPFQSIYGGSYGYYGDENKVSEGMTLLTDRSLYRPGQIVYVKGIALIRRNLIRQMYFRTRTILLFDMDTK